ncbi:RNA polymerase sigma-70 factor (ECF subfamily) [Sinobacterium caligoides]|uniref:RNA polymerase sigma-70 factor (ECF subfamily) n=1 Tax=Sinobacterium caligoides TaxID=933926 RepID=A0A3N2E179_9GAMM|nr:sigma-70 family RNA polymerase sigma factor [Sinobacterium caligoides]ROS05325.1 RNA polymerase sigma-70 factor (ECF subfamily) [Sinobacterium caligoides]
MFTSTELNQLYQYAHILTNDRDDAYDLLQNCLEKFLRRRPITLSKMGYLKKMIKHQFIDQYRHQHRYPKEALCSVNETHALPHSLEKTMIDQQTLERLWLKLPSADRELLYLWAVEGLTHRQIGQRLQRPIGTVLSQVHRLKKKLSRDKVRYIAEVDGR